MGTNCHDDIQLFAAHWDVDDMIWLLFGAHDDHDMTSLSPSPPTTRDMLTIGFAKNFMSLYAPVNAFPCYDKASFNKAELKTQ